MLEDGKSAGREGADSLKEKKGKPQPQRRLSRLMGRRATPLSPEALLAELAQVTSKNSLENKWQLTLNRLKQQEQEQMAGKQ